MSQQETLPPEVGGAHRFQLQVIRRGGAWVARYLYVLRGITLFATPYTAETEREARAMLCERVKKQGFLD